jgi:excinuclease ABC subunit C
VFIINIVILNIYCLFIVVFSKIPELIPRRRIKYPLMIPISQLIINKIPDQPGCYLFRDQRETIIYIGKAQNLKKRIKSYFLNTFENYFRKQIYSLNTIVTSNVKEALILEQNLIKKHQPRFNVLLKDSNYYPYLVITNEKNPHYKVLRKIN